MLIDREATTAELTAWLRASYRHNGPIILNTSFVRTLTAKGVDMATLKADGVWIEEQPIPTTRTIYEGC